MNKNILIVVVLILVLGGGYYAYSNQSATPQNSEQQAAAGEPTVDPEGKDRSVYVGQTPCADCEGIEIRLVLKENGKYRLTNTYLGKDAEPFVEKGTYEMKKDANGDMLVLTSNEDSITNFRETDSGITQLDTAMQPMSDNPYAMNLSKKR